MTPADLREIVKVMTEMKVMRLHAPAGQVGGIVGPLEIELHPSAFAAPALVVTDPPLEPEPTPEEILFASSVPVTQFERDGKDPE